METRLKPDRCSDPAETGVANRQCQEAISGPSPGSKTRPPFPSPSYGPCRTSWTARQQPRSPPVTTTNLVAGPDTNPRGMAALRTVLAYCQSHCLSDYIRKQPFYSCLLQPCCGPRCYSHLSAIASQRCYAPLKTTAVFLLSSLSHSHSLSTAVITVFLMCPKLYHSKCSYNLNLPLVISSSCHSYQATEAVVPASEDVPVGHLQLYLGGEDPGGG